MAKRKCGTCGNDIIVSRHNLDNVVFYQNRYHHIECILDKIEQGIKSGKRIANWEKLQNRISELQEKAKENLYHGVVRDEFNEYLLEYYDVVSISNRFWQIVEEIENGIYKRKKCRPIDIETLMEAWKWGQKNLDKIAASNRAKNKGPQNDEQRLNYDLAIVLQHINQYKKYIEKKQMNITETRRNSTFDEVDMSKIGQKEIEKKEGISDIFEDFFS